MFTFFHGCGIPPVTLTCPSGGGAQAQTIVGPTGWQGCINTVPPACYGPTGTQGCTMPPNCLGPTGTQGCGHGGAQAQTIFPTVTTTVVPTLYMCITKTAGAHAQNVGPTGTQGCTIPPHCVGPTGNQGCTIVGPTGYQGCGQVGAQAQAATGHCITGDNGCTMTCNNTAHNCPADAQTIGPTGTQGCTVVGPTGYQGCGGTMATVCTQVGCGPTHLIGCTGYQGCHPQSTLATVCTQVGCNQGGGAQAQIPTIPVADCIPTRSCTGAWPIC